MMVSVNVAFAVLELMTTVDAASGNVLTICCDVVAFVVKALIPNNDPATIGDLLGLFNVPKRE